jgi:hypothetical protein
MHATQQPSPYAALASRLARQGFRPGAPAHLTPLSLAVDRLLCMNLRCPSCRRRRTMRLAPFTDGAAYRGVARCRHCGHGEEV